MVIIVLGSICAGGVGNIGDGSEPSQQDQLGRLLSRILGALLGGYWRRVIAIGIVAGLTPLGQAQVDQEQSQRPPDQQETPADELSAPVPVVIVETDEAAEARKAAEHEASQRENEDLVAQQGMYFATQRMANYAFVQTFLVALGTIALIWTLWETRKAAKATAKAAIETENATKATLLIARKNVEALFIVKVEGGALHWAPDDFSFEAKIKIEHVGNAAAFNVFGYFALEAIRGWPQVDIGETMRWAYVPAGQRQIPPWSFEKTILRPGSGVSLDYPFYQLVGPGMNMEWENEFSDYPTFRLHVFLEWTDIYRETCGTHIILGSFDDGKVWKEVDRADESLDEFSADVKYPY